MAPGAPENARPDESPCLSSRIAACRAGRLRGSGLRRRVSTDACNRRRFVLDSRKTTRGTETKKEDPRPRLRRAALGIPVLALALVGSGWPGPAATEVTLEFHNFMRVVDATVFYYHEKAIARRMVQSTCYFDPDVEDSLRCSSRSNDQGADLFNLLRESKGDARKRCKKAGGRKCVEFWRNGKMKYGGLAPVDHQKVEYLLQDMALFESEPRLLPEGVGVSSGFRKQFEELRNLLDGVRKKRRGHGPHYALCASERGPWAFFVLEGGPIDPAKVSKMCILKCKAMGAYFSHESDCHVIVEDGEFASAAAEAAVMQ